MPNALRTYAYTQFPQTEKADPRQVRNNAGGYSFKVAAKARLERFLILGTDNGTYYVGERELTKDNVWFVSSTIEADEKLVADTVVDVSTSGRAYRNSAAIFTLAMLLIYGKDKQRVHRIVPSVVRTATHLYEFVEYLDKFSGWGQSKKKAVNSWFSVKDADSLAYQAVKYRQRNGWTLRDVMRLSHPKFVDTSVAKFILGREVVESAPEIIHAFQAVQAAESVDSVVKFLKYYSSLPWEAVPTQFLKNADVWKTLFYNNQLNGQALLRNITRLSRIGAFDDIRFAGDYAGRVADSEMIRRTRLHPLQYLLASITHERGQLQRSAYSWTSYREKNWNTVPVIAEALQKGMYSAFNTIEPSNKRTLLAVDISSSMRSPAAGVDLSSAEISAAMAMVIARTEPYWRVMGFAKKFVDLPINPSMSFEQVLQKTTDRNFGGTDCSLPMVWALKNRVEVDTFIIITDNETWYGDVHPYVALNNYRKIMGIDARLAVVATTSTGFSIANPSDSGMLDVVGFDTNSPRMIADFSAGRI